MTTFDTLAEMESHVGEELGVSDWLEVTQERIDAFAEATDDRQWIHTDPEAARDHSPYGTTVAHGFLVLSLAPRFTSEAYEVQDTVMGVNYGLDRVRFPAPTPPGARLRGRVVLEGFEKIERGARLTLGITFELEDDEKPACVAEFVALAYTG
jgi:acyl dehydratase